MLVKIKKRLKKIGIIQILFAKRNVRINKKRQKKIKNPTKLLIEQYENYYKRKPNLVNPKRFSELLLWQKLYYYKPQATILSDKIAVKKYIENLIGPKISFAKTIAVFDKVEDIVLANLPQKSVIKCNHISGYIFYVERTADNKYIIRDLKDGLNNNIKFKTMKKLLNEMLKINFYYVNFEWNYKNIPPKIFVEEYLDMTNLLEFKFHMNYDQLKLFYVISNRQIDERDDYFDSNLQPMNVWADVPPSDVVPSLPNNILDMIEISKKIAKDYPMLRVDLYTLNGKIYFGEATFFPMAGLLRFKYPKNLDELMGQDITIKLKDLNTRDASDNSL